MVVLIVDASGIWLDSDMAQTSDWGMPRVLQCPPWAGWKPALIPDTTQFPGVTRSLFGVSCSIPEEAFRWGVYNELFLLSLNVPPEREATIPRKVLARVSRDDKTNSDINMESEIATMVYVKYHTTIPVPTVYGYCPTRDNVIGQPFMILSFTEGTDMNGAPWEDLDVEVKLIAIRDYARIIIQLSRLQFDAIGSLYLKHGAPPPDCFELGPIAWCKHESATRKNLPVYDRGPWKTSGQWLRAAVTDEIQFMGKCPELAQTTHGHRIDGGARWRLAQTVLPQFRDRIADVIEDPLDRCAGGPFVLAHMDLNPWNMIFSSEGPSAGRIVAVIDWEMAATVPLWSLVCYPAWFGRAGYFRKRDPVETQLLKDTYIRELQKYVHDTLILRVVQNIRAESRRRFAEAAVLPWDTADSMERWMGENRGQP